MFTGKNFIFTYLAFLINGLRLQDDITETDTWKKKNI